MAGANRDVLVNESVTLARINIARMPEAYSWARNEGTDEG